MIQFKRGKTASWANQTEPLADGQPGYDKDTHELKIGDGTTAFADLPAIGSGYTTGLESISNKTTSISSTSTDTQYPSAKAVYTAVNAKESTSNKVTSLSSSSTNTQYPSAKLVYDQLALKQSSSYKTTSVSASSTDTYYPSAKAVYTFVNNNYPNVTSGTFILSAYLANGTKLTNTSTCNYYKVGKLVTVYGAFPRFSGGAYRLTGLPYTAVNNFTITYGNNGDYSSGLAYVISSDIRAGYAADGYVKNDGSVVFDSVWAEDELQDIIHRGSAFTITYMTNS